MARIQKIMLKSFPKLKKEDKVGEAAKLLAREENGCVFIVENDALVGIFTELDFVRNLVSKGKNYIKQPISKVMTYPVTYMEPDMKLDEALKTIDTKRFRRYPVIENGKLVGLVTKKDIVNAMSDNIKFHRNLQNIVLVIFVLFQFFIFVINPYLS